MALLISQPVLVENCLTNIWADQTVGRIEQVKEFNDLNEDGIKEKIAFVSGGPTSGLRYSVIYTETDKGCYHKIFGRTENVALGSTPKALLKNNSTENDIYNGYKVLLDSNADHYMEIYLFSMKTKQYVQAYTISRSQWMQQQKP